MSQINLILKILWSLNLSTRGNFTGYHFMQIRDGHASLELIRMWTMTGKVEMN